MSDGWEVKPETRKHISDGESRPLLLWRLPKPMLAIVEAVAAAVDGGVRVFATVGLKAPVWAAGAEGAAASSRAGTINLVAILPVRLSDAALVNSVMTLTEAKTQALLEAGVPGTGTASDAACVLCPPRAAAERFCGPRSRWGGRLARAVHRAVARGIAETGGG